VNWENKKNNKDELCTSVFLRLESCIFVEVDDLFVIRNLQGNGQPKYSAGHLIPVHTFHSVMYFLTSFMKEYDKNFSSFRRILNSLLSILINCPQHFPKVESFSSF
jgi:hypothetical protein